VVTNADETGIDIQASDVHIDLNGFTIRGPVSCTGLQGTLS
jgi:hypothetical protein